MNATLILIELVGGIALLLWGVHMVRTGVGRALGSALRDVLRRAAGNRFSAAIAGLAITVPLRSSTATAIITGAFAERRLIGLTAALAVMLGADIGTAVAAQLLAVDLRLLSPVAKAALLTWLAHASIAMILTVAGLVGAGVVPHAMAVPFVLGANAGAAIAPVVATAGSSPAGRRPALGNLVMRGSGALLALAALPWTAPSSSPISAPARPLS